MLSKVLSLVIAAFYVFIGCYYYGNETSVNFLRISGSTILIGLVCIWFGDELGGMTVYFGHGRVTTPTPGGLVRFMGWIKWLSGEGETQRIELNENSYRN